MDISVVTGKARTHLRTVQECLKSFNMEIPTEYEGIVNFIISYLAILKNFESIIDQKWLTEHRLALKKYYDAIKMTPNPADDERVHSWLENHRKKAQENFKDDISSTNSESSVYSANKIKESYHRLPKVGYSHFLEIAVLKEEMRKLKEVQRKEMEDMMRENETLKIIVHEFLDHNNTKHEQQNEQFRQIEHEITELKRILGNNSEQVNNVEVYRKKIKTETQ
eukprot:NODE_534_length_7054_cov_0.303666.p4 type:complete len:223 gc:universal NODE_534_length_7054_cov_0.303666:723-1391(+)